MLAPSDLAMILSACWVMERSWRVSSKKEIAVIPDLRHLVVSALVLSGEVGEDDEIVWEGDVLGNEKSVAAQKVQLWVMSTAPGLASCFSRYVQEKLKACVAAGSSEVSLERKLLLCLHVLHFFYMSNCNFNTRMWHIVT